MDAASPGSSEKMEKIVSRIVESIGSAVAKESKFVSVDADKLKLEESNFRKISAKEGKVAFIDGGNAELIKTPSISVQFIRIACCIYEGKDKGECRKKEFYVVVTAEGNDVSYKTEVMGEDTEFGNFDSLDKSMMTGNNRVSISKIGELCRKIAELRMCREVEADLIVRDGDLEADADAEKEEYRKKPYTTRYPTRSQSICRYSLSFPALGRWLRGNFAKRNPRSTGTRSMAPRRNVVPSTTLPTNFSFFAAASSVFTAKEARCFCASSTKWYPANRQLPPTAK